MVGAPSCRLIIRTTDGTGNPDLDSAGTYNAPIRTIKRERGTEFANCLDEGGSAGYESQRANAEFDTESREVGVGSVQRKTGCYECGSPDKVGRGRIRWSGDSRAPSMPPECFWSDCAFVKLSASQVANL